MVDEHDLVHEAPSQPPRSKLERPEPPSEPIFSPRTTLALVVLGPFGIAILNLLKLFEII